MKTLDGRQARYVRDLAGRVYYDIDGCPRPLPRVTDILGVIHKPKLAAWRERQGTEQADRLAREAADIGTAVHGAIERALAGESVKLDPGSPAAPLFEAWRHWEREIGGIRPVALETVIYSPRHGYAGRADAVAQIGSSRRLVVLDIKTSAAVWPEHALQLAAYRAAARELGWRVHGRMVVRIDKVTQTVEPVSFYDHAEDMAVFLAALRLFSWQRSKEKEVEGA